MILSLPRNTAKGPTPLGAVRLPGSKSVSNRALLLAAMAPGWSRLDGVLDAEDTRWMREALAALGIPLAEDQRAWILEGGARPVPSGPLWLGASGTCLRFLLPWLALRATRAVDLAGEPRLFERPLGPLVAALQQLGATWTPRGSGGRLVPAATITGLDLEVDGQLSSQFISGLAMAAATLPEGGALRWLSPVASASYLALTARWLEAFGCRSELRAEGWRVPGGALRPADLRLPADWSGAAAFLAAAAVTGRPVRIGPLDPADAQRDRDLVDILGRAGCRAEWQGQELRLAGPLVRGLVADLEPCPDLGPVLAATAALAPAPSVLTGLHTLPLKECDRLDASRELVEWLGGRAEVEGDHTLRVWPGGPPAEDRPPFDPRSDHRMAFAAAVGALRWGGRLADPDCVAKTFPEFWRAWDGMLGASP